MKKLLLVLFLCGSVISHTAHAEKEAPDFLTNFKNKNCSKDVNSRVRKLQRLIKDEQNRYGDDVKTLRAVNWFFYKQLFLREDTQIWYRGDYWATPAEMLCKGKGDSEDFAIAKYFVLKEIGISEERLRLVHAEGRYGPVVILLYYPGGDGDEPFLLGYKRVVALSKVGKSLKPVYAFNAYTLWIVKGDWHFTRTGDVRNLKYWQSVLSRMRTNRK